MNRLTEKIKQGKGTESDSGERIMLIVGICRSFRPLVLECSTAGLEIVNKGKELYCSAPQSNRTFHDRAIESRYLIMLAEAPVGLLLIEGAAVNYFG